MLIRGMIKPLYAPENESGVDDQLLEGQDPQVSDDGGEAVEDPQTLRQQLEKNFAEDKKAANKPDNKKYQSRARQAAAEEGTPTDGVSQDKSTNQSQTQPPEAFSKEAKAEWANVPSNVQAAIIKREQDVAKGVEELKGKYADIDRAIAPHIEAIRSHGNTPAQAVAQLFGWFQALAANPKEAFPALARSFNLDLNTLVQPAQQNTQNAPAPEGKQPAGEVPPAVQEYITGIEQKLAQLGQAFEQKLGVVDRRFEQQNQAKTQEILDFWSKDKKYFQDVRTTMAQLIQSGAVPLSETGQVDLDRAYDAAIWAIPEVRSKVIAEQEASKNAEAAKALEEEKKAQRAQAEKARRAAGSLASSSPGAPSAPGAKKGGKGKSVRESLMEARAQLTE